MRQGVIQHRGMPQTPMTPLELAAWTAQQSARHERTFAPARAARALDAGLQRIRAPRR